MAWKTQELKRLQASRELLWHGCCRGSGGRLDGEDEVAGSPGCWLPGADVK